MLKDFIEEWFPKTKEWDNIGKFILDSGIQLTKDVNPKWLTGYTNIGTSYKPHHKDDYIRYMEESMFILHDVVHNIFTLNIGEDVTEEEYVKRQIYGELFTFYLVEYIIPRLTLIKSNNRQYILKRGSYTLMMILFEIKPRNRNIIDYMYDCFINNLIPYKFKSYSSSSSEEILKKYSKMFKEDLENSRKNFKFVPKGLKSYCMVGQTAKNHVDFFKEVKKGTIKNIRRDFNINLPEQWI